MQSSKGHEDDVCFNQPTTGKITTQIFKPIKKKLFNILNMIQMVKGLQHLLMKLRDLELEKAQGGISVGAE